MEIIEDSWTCQYGKEKLQMVHHVLWEMYVLISDIFDKHGITYFLSYGSMLGALRHNGFIPWDDDFDICVMQDDYTRAIKILQDHLPKDKYIVHNKESDSIYWLDYTKIRFLHSKVYCALWPDDDKLKYRGICLDIFRCWEESQSRYTNKCKQCRQSVLWYRTQLRHVKHSFLHESRLIMGLLYNRLKLCCYSLLDMIAPRKQVFIMDPEDIAKPFDSKLLFPLNKVLFNGRACPVPYKATDILQNQYGEWQELPAVKKRTSHFQNVEIW